MKHLWAEVERIVKNSKSLQQITTTLVKCYLWCWSSSTTFKPSSWPKLCKFIKDETMNDFISLDIYAYIISATLLIRKKKKTGGGRGNGKQLMKLSLFKAKQNSLTFPPPMPKPLLLSSSSRRLKQLELWRRSTSPSTPRGPKALSLKSSTVKWQFADIMAVPRCFW